MRVKSSRRAPESSSFQEITPELTFPHPFAPSPGLNGIDLPTQGTPLGGTTFLLTENLNPPDEESSFAIRTVVVNGGPPQVYYQEAKKNPPVAVTSFPSGVSYFKLSPGGSRLLLGTPTKEGGMAVYLLKKDGTLPRPLLTNPTAYVGSVAWAPNSRWFAYTSNERNPRDLDLYRFDLSKRRGSLLSRLSGENRATDISPDGMKIALESISSHSRADILLWSVSRKKLTNLTQRRGKWHNHSPRFTGDSNSVYYLSDEKAGWHQLFLSKLSPKGEVKVLTAETGEYRHDEEVVEMLKKRQDFFYRHIRIY